MSGHRPFNELTMDFSPVRRERIDNRKAELRAAMTLSELRRAQQMTQQALGRAKDVDKPTVAKPECRTDV